MISGFRLGPRVSDWVFSFRVQDLYFREGFSVFQIGNLGQSDIHVWFNGFRFVFQIICSFVET